jgi:hypothetical protein
MTLFVTNVFSLQSFFYKYTAQSLRMSKYLLVLFFVIAVIAVIAMLWPYSVQAPVTSVPMPSQVDNSSEVFSHNKMEPVETVIIDNHPKKRNFTNFFRV